MIIFPAIDIRGGNCVRLSQGAFETAERVAESPMKAAQTFKAAGAQWLHMVDLDGALERRPVNAEIFLTVARESGLLVELGGGIRDMESVDLYIRGGISRVILGSVALENPALVKQAAEKYPGKIAVGIDAKDGMVRTNGWLTQSNVSFIDLAKEMECAGIGTIIYTDIGRDGMLSGVNLEELLALNQAVSCDIIASGGVRDIHDIRALVERGLYGAICGKSLYSGTLDLKSALGAAGGAE